MSKPRYWKLPARTLLKQLATMYFLVVPVLMYFSSTTLTFARNNHQLFLASSVVTALVGAVMVVIANSLAMRRMRRFLEPVGDKPLEDPTVVAAVKCARRYPAIHAALVAACWILLANVRVPYFILKGATMMEVVAMLGLTTLTGMVSAVLFSLIAQRERDAFLELPGVHGVSLGTGARRRSLTSRLALTIGAMIAYPTGVLALLITLAGTGTISLKGSATGLILVVAVTVVLSMLVCMLLARSISRPLRESSDAAGRISEGDLRTTVAARSADEVGALVDRLNGMSSRLRDMVGSIQVSAEQVAASSQQISRGAQTLSEGAQSQASTLEETSAAVEELIASVDQVSDSAQSQASAVRQGAASMTRVVQSIDAVLKSFTEITTLADRSVESSEQGAQAVQQVVDGMNTIAGSSEKIAGFVQVISDIADQTNLLSLNAAIEAARAGEHGRGFAVVAQAVSKLADRSATSAREIASLIQESTGSVTQGVEIAWGSHAAMARIKEASKKVKTTIAALSQDISQQSTAVGELRSALQSVDEMSQSISAATGEQTTNARQVSAAVENVNEITQGAASAAEQMSSATVQLSAMARDLQRLVAQFTIAG